MRSYLSLCSWVRRHSLPIVSAGTKSFAFIEKSLYLKSPHKLLELFIVLDIYLNFSVSFNNIGGSFVKAL